MTATEDSNVQEPWTGKKVLIVDDYHAIRKTVVEIAREVGLECVEAENGLKAQEMLKKESIDLVITDLVMPEMDGFELTESIKSSAQWYHIPVIINSTHADSRYIFKALKLGADDYLTKPTNRDMIIAVLSRIYDNDW